MKAIPTCFLISFLALNSYSQQPNTIKPSILRSTITSVGSSTVHIPNKNYLIAQSIGQTGIIGKADGNSISVQQGFLTNIISFKVNNSVNNPINEVLDFVISPNPFVDYIKIDFSEKTSQDIYIKIYDINGKVFNYKKYLPASRIVIPMSRLSIGNYLIQIKSGRNIATKKILKIE